MYLKPFGRTQTPFRHSHTAPRSEYISDRGAFFWTRGIQRQISGGEITWVHLEAFCHTQTPTRPQRAVPPSESTSKIAGHFLNERNCEANEWRENYLGEFKDILSHIQTSSKPRREVRPSLNPPLSISNLRWLLWTRGTVRPMSEERKLLGCIWKPSVTRRHQPDPRVPLVRVNMRLRSQSPFLDKTHLSESIKRIITRVEEEGFWTRQRVSIPSK